MLKFKKEKIILISGSTKQIEDKLKKSKNKKFFSQVIPYKRQNVTEDTPDNFFQITNDESNYYGEQGYKYKLADQEINAYLQ